jgi:hypothetical protein
MEAERVSEIFRRAITAVEAVQDRPDDSPSRELLAESEKEYRELVGDGAFSISSENSDSARGKSYRLPRTKAALFYLSTILAEHPATSSQERIDMYINALGLALLDAESLVDNREAVFVMSGESGDVVDCDQASFVGTLFDFSIATSRFFHEEKRALNDRCLEVVAAACRLPEEGGERRGPHSVAVSWLARHLLLEASPFHDSSSTLPEYVTFSAKSLLATKRSLVDSGPEAIADAKRAPPHVAAGLQILLDRYARQLQDDGLIEEMAELPSLQFVQ